MKKIIKDINYWASEKYINTFKYQPFVQVILLHKIYPSRADVIPHNGSISEGMDATQFEFFIKYFTIRGIRFIDETDIVNGTLNPNEQYIYLTFDDGYYNNNYALKILNKYNAKATFYISTSHIEEGKSFWWDVQYRERIKHGKDKTYISQEIKDMYQLTWKEQEKYIIKEFGDRALFPFNDLDRPMTKEELRTFATNKSVYLGNHTHNHLNTTIYSKTELVESILIAEKFLEEISQKSIKSISYPYGFYNSSVIEIMRELEYKIGITVKNGKNTINDLLNKEYQLELNRTQLSGFHDLNTQLHNINTGFSIINNIKSYFKKKS